MQSVVCPHCYAPVPAGTTFCGSCGTRMLEASLDPPTRLTYPTASSGPPLEAQRPSVDPYAASYPSGPAFPAQPRSGQPTSMPPMLPLVSARRRRHRALIIVGSLMLLVVGLGGGGYLAFSILHPVANIPTSAHTGALGHGSNGAPNTGTGTSTSSGGLSLPTINRQATYAGASFTIQSAQKANSFPEFQQLNAGDDVVKVRTRIENQTPQQLLLLDKVHLLSPDGSSLVPSVTEAASALPELLYSGASATGFWYFEVNRDQSGVGAYKLVLGGAQEVQETIPFIGSYDASVWQWVTKPIGKSVTYKVGTTGGSVIGTVVKASTGLWTPGYQAPKGMRFLLTDLLVTNRTALPLNVTADPLKLQEPDGVSESATTTSGYFVNDLLQPGASKDEGYVSFLVPPDKGDFILFFYDQDGSVAGQVDLGTL